MHIREAIAADAAAIARVHVESWRTTYRGLMPDAVLDGLSVEQRQRQWERWLSNERDDLFAYVAEDSDDQIIGFALAGTPVEMDEVPGYDGELQAIYLLQSTQRQGIGRRLVAAVAERLSQAGFSTMLLWVLGENHPSRRFYERIGGRYLMSKPFEIGGATLEEVAYGWDDLPALVASLAQQP